MVKLYYTPTSCGAASFISAYSEGLKVECAQVDLASKKVLTTGEDFFRINPKGNVPTIVLDDGTTLSENVACLMALADMAPEAGLVPMDHTGRLVVENAISFIGTEIHAAIGPLFRMSDDSPKEVRAFVEERVHQGLTKLADVLLEKGNKKYLVGDRFTVADAYAYIVISWLPFLKIDDSRYPVLQDYRARIAALPNVQAAHKRMEQNPAVVAE